MAPPQFFFEIDGAEVEAVDDGGVYTRDGVTITRGYADENSNLRPGRASFTLKNHDLHYTGDNPMSPYHGKFGQGTPWRLAAFRYPTVKGLWTPPSTAGGATTPDSVALSITGDIDLRAAAPVHQVGYYLVTKAGSYALMVDSTNHVALQWIASFPTTITRTSTATVPAGHTAYRATLDVNNGAAGHTVTFYTAAAWGDAWVQLGSTVVTAGTTSIVNSTEAAFTAGTTGTAGPMCITHAEILSGISGTVVASPDYTVQTDGDDAFADAQGNTWTVDADSYIGSGISQTRFVGEMSEAKHLRDASDTDHYVRTEVSGITQRLSQGGGAKLATALETWIPQRTAASFKAEGYWPLNEGLGAVAGRSRLGGADMVFTSPTNPIGRFGSGDVRLPWLDNGITMFAGDTMRGIVNMASGSATAWEFDFIYACQDGADTVVNMYTASKKVWHIYFRPSINDIGFIGPDGIEHGTATWDFDPFDGVGKLVQFRVWPNAGVPTTAQAFLVISTNYEGEGAFGTNDIIDDGLQAGNPLTAVSQLEWFEFEHIGTAERPFVLSHVAAFSALDLTSIYTIEVPAAGNILEQADARMTRVTDEKDVPFTTESSYVTALMGAQKPTDFLSIMDECATADAGLLFESRDALSLRYRPLAELHNDDAVLTLDYAGSQVAPPFEPVRDDQMVRNAVTAKRTDGGEATFEQTVGRYSVSDPVDGGVGRYDSTVTVNVRSDNQLGNVAGWAVHLGTWDEPRTPTVTVIPDELSDELADAVFAVDVGDRIDITNLSALGIYDTVSLLVLGYTETWDSAVQRITFNCVPQRPYRVVRLDTAGMGKLDSLGTTLNEDLDTTETSVEVAVSDAGLWSTTATPITITVGGEVMTVTNVTGASSPQTFTVTRSVNGVVKTHSTGDLVQLERAATLAHAQNP
jgi:hypothetical protein